LPRRDDILGVAWPDDVGASPSPPETPSKKKMTSGWPALPKAAREELAALATQVATAA
jgi:hypothetical protein